MIDWPRSGYVQGMSALRRGGTISSVGLLVGLALGLGWASEAKASSYSCSPELIPLVPSAGATEVPVDVALAVATDNEGCFELEYHEFELTGPDGPIEITIETSRITTLRDTAILRPTAPLEPGTDYVLAATGEATTEIAFTTGTGLAEALPDATLELAWVELSYPDIDGTGLIHTGAVTVTGIPDALPAGTTLVLRRPDRDGFAVYGLPGSDGRLDLSLRADGGDEVCVEVALRAANGVESPASNLACLAGEAIEVEDEDEDASKGCSVVDGRGQQPWSLALLGLVGLLGLGRRRSATGSARP